jgi:putative peptidoglycan lipid II flippase
MALIRHTAAVSGLTLLSRILGVIRDAAIAMVLGTTAVSDAFFIAFRPFDLLRKMVSDGIFSISFIPPFSRHVQAGRQDEAVSMVTSAAGILTAAGGALILGGWLLAPWILSVMAPGFAPDNDQFTLTLVLFRLMMPYLWVILMISLSMGVLHALGNFWVPGATPIIFNLGVILFVLVTPLFMKAPVIGLAMGVMAGGISQLVFQLPFMIRQGMIRPNLFVWRHPQVADSLKKTIPCMVGAAPYQINMLVISILASLLVNGSVSHLYYADRLVQFPVALIAVSISTVLLPFFSRQAAAGEITHIQEIFDTGIRLAVFAAIPAMAGLMVLNEPIVRLLFGQGAFDTPAVMRTADCLLYLAPGMGAFIGTRLLVTVHYALDSIERPFHAGLISMVTNLVCAPILMYFMAVQGLALAVTLSSVAGFIFLMCHSPPDIPLSKSGILVSGCRALFLSAIMTIFIQVAKQFFLFDDESKLLLGVQVTSCVILGMAVVWIGAKIFCLPEFHMVEKWLKNRSENRNFHEPH